MFAQAADALLAQAREAERASKAREAVALYKRVMESGDGKDATLVEAMERYLIFATNWTADGVIGTDRRISRDG